MKTANFIGLAILVFGVYRLTSPGLQSIEMERRRDVINTIIIGVGLGLLLREA